MKKYSTLLLGGLAGIAGLGLFSCSENDAPANNDILPQGSVKLVSDTGDFSVAQFDTLHIRLSVYEGLSDIQWMLDGKKVADDVQFSFLGNKTGTHELLLTACATDGTQVKLEQKLAVTPRFGKGTFILNEGNMSDETGTLTFIDEKGVAIDSAYFRVNGTLLGNVCQDLFIDDHKIYIISQNGAKNGGEGMLTVMQADNLEKLKIYNEGLENTLSWPSNLAVVEGNIYIRDNKGVYFFDTNTTGLQFIEGTEHMAKMRMAVADGKVFAGCKDEVVVMKDAKVVQRIPMAGMVSGIVSSYDKKLWVSCNTKPGTIIKLNPSDGKIIDRQEVSVGGLSAGWGVAPAFSAVQDTLYFCNATTSLYRHIFKEGKTEEIADIKSLLPDAGMYYNSLGVNPVNGIICFATLKGYGIDYKINDIALFDFTRENPLVSDFKSMNSFPAGVYYTYSFKE